MRRNVGKAAVVALAALCAAGPAPPPAPAPAAAYWVGAVNGRWDVAANWSTGAVPNATTDVVFDAARGVADCHYRGKGGRIARSITIRRGYTGTLRLAADGPIDLVRLDQADGRISLPGDAKVSVDHWNWSGGDFGVP